MNQPMNIAPILASTFVMPDSSPSLDTNDIINNLLPVLGFVGPGLVVMMIMAIVTFRKNRPS